MKMSFWDLTDSAIVKDSYYALGIVKDSSQILQIELNLPGKNAEFEAQSKDNLNRKKNLTVKP